MAAPVSCSPRVALCPGLASDGAQWLRARHGVGARPVVAAGGPGPSGLGQPGIAILAFWGLRGRGARGCPVAPSQTLFRRCGCFGLKWRQTWPCVPMRAQGILRFRWAELGKTRVLTGPNTDATGLPTVGGMGLWWVGAFSGRRLLDTGRVMQRFSPMMRSSGRRSARCLAESQRTCL